MKFQEIIDSTIWDQFLKEIPNVTVLASWQWGEFEKKQGANIFRYGMYEDGKLVGVLGYKVINARRGKYLYLRQSIALDWNNEKFVEDVLKFLVSKAKEHGVWYVRIASMLPDNSGNRELFKGYGLRESFSPSIDAQRTVILDLSKDINQIAMELRKNTRYLIRKGEKMGVEIKRVSDLSLWDDFCTVYTDTVDRHRWNAHSLKYIKEQYSYFAKNGMSEMFIAKYKGDTMSASIFTRYNNQVMYHHSGSISSMKDIPAMYVLLWNAIKYYKSLGIKEFNFWGVSPKESVNHPWYGLSLFKRGFTDEERTLLPTYDLVIRPQSYITFLFEYLERSSRNLS